MEKLSSIANDGILTIQPEKESADDTDSALSQILVRRWYGI